MAVVRNPTPIISIFVCIRILNYGYPDADIRLVGNVDEREGTVEIMYKGIWGAICDDGWDDTDATVVCRELGFLNGTATSPLFEFSSGPVWLTQVECLGNESTVSECPHNGVGNVGNCSHAQDAGVQCNGVKGTLAIRMYLYECS